MRAAKKSLVVVERAAYTGVFTRFKLSVQILFTGSENGMAISPGRISFSTPKERRWS
jgi:hypothetical protein